MHRFLRIQTSNISISFLSRCGSVKQSSTYFRIIDKQQYGFAVGLPFGRISELHYQSLRMHTRFLHSLGGSSEDTIFALATPVGRGAIAVIRISGPAASNLLQSFMSNKELPPPRRASLRILVDPTTRDPLDTAVVLWFPGPASYTGQDMVELQVHGGVAVVDGLLASLCSQPLLRLATPGEFTRRALLNGKLDLVEAEGLADLLLVRGLLPSQLNAAPIGRNPSRPQTDAFLTCATCRRKPPRSAAPPCARSAPARA